MSQRERLLRCPSCRSTKVRVSESEEYRTWYEQRPDGTWEQTLEGDCVGRFKVRAECKSCDHCWVPRNFGHMKIHTNIGE